MLLVLPRESTYSTMYGHTYMDQPGKVASPVRGQLNRKMNISLSAFVPENLVSRDGFGSPVPRQPAHLHTQAGYGIMCGYVDGVHHQAGCCSVIRYRVREQESVLFCNKVQVTGYGNKKV